MIIFSLCLYCSLCFCNTLYAQLGADSKFNQWIDRDDTTAIYQMEFMTGSSCIPKQNKLKFEIKSNVVLIKDFQNQVCTDDIAQSYIYASINKKQYPNYKTMKVVYLYNADDTEYDFATQQIVAIKPEVLNKSYRYLSYSRTTKELVANYYMAFNFYSNDSILVEKYIVNDFGSNIKKTLNKYASKKYAYKFVDKKYVQIEGLEGFTNFRVYKNRLVASMLQDPKVIETVFIEFDNKEWANLTKSTAKVRCTPITKTRD